MNSIQFLSECKKKNKAFFYFAILILIVYVLQLVFRVEITPLGYFSLYSNRCTDQNSYRQILPFNGDSSKPVNIYEAKGGAFLMLEILPTRYHILKQSENCNNLSPVLKRLGIQSDNSSGDCNRLEKFGHWFRLYAERTGIHVSDSFGWIEYGFKNGVCIDKNGIE